MSERSARRNEPSGVEAVGRAAGESGRFANGGGPPLGALRDAAEGLLPYPVWLAPGSLDALGAVLRRDAPAHRHALLTDTAVARHHLARACDAFAAADLAPPLVVEIPPGEAHKTRERWAAVTDRLLEAGCGRDTTLVALGGGVVGDLGGFGDHSNPK